MQAISPLGLAYLSVLHKERAHLGVDYAAPTGTPIKIGGTLALTGPLAATALLHKITAAGLSSAEDRIVAQQKHPGHCREEPQSVEPHEAAESDGPGRIVAGLRVSASPGRRTRTLISASSSDRSTGALTRVESGAPGISSPFFNHWYVGAGVPVATTVKVAESVRAGRYVQATVAGIVADSVPASEYQETLNKAKGLEKAIEVAEQQL